ncbi:MAG: methyltransferase domain-containing protein [Clostridia bacterium]|nr:methyltransferase domain-containing protein [Clostridia bacterium]
MGKKGQFVPALGFHRLTRFFDPLVRSTMLEQKLKKILLQQAHIANDEVMLDFGCGTGTLAVMAKKAAPKAIIHGVDVDPNILKIAHNKVKSSHLDIFLSYYDGTFLPYDDKMFHKVLSSLVFHHLSRDQKNASLKEIYRVMKTGGELHILDFGKAGSILMRILFLPNQILDGFVNTSDNVKGLLPDIIRSNGFTSVEEYHRRSTVFGTISFLRAVKKR